MRKALQQRVALPPASPAEIGECSAKIGGFGANYFVDSQLMQFWSRVAASNQKACRYNRRKSLLLLALV